MMAFARSGAQMARLESVRPALVAMEPAFLTAEGGARATDDGHSHDGGAGGSMPCAGCGRVHRDRLVRFFQVRYDPPVRATRSGASIIAPEEFAGGAYSFEGSMRVAPPPSLVHETPEYA
jgi:hypothetical protein